MVFLHVLNMTIYSVVCRISAWIRCELTVITHATIDVQKTVSNNNSLCINVLVRPAFRVLVIRIGRDASDNSIDTDTIQH